MSRDAMIARRARMVGAIRLGARVLVTGCILAAFCFLMDFGRVCLLTVQSRHGQAHNEPPAAQNVSLRSGTTVPASASLWPLFPGSAGRKSHEIVINGAKFICESWQTMASGFDVLDYYRQQMSACGWEDVTETTMNLDPEKRGWGSSANRLGDPRFSELYQRIMNSNLVIRKDPWSIHLVAEPVGDGLLRTKVSIMASTAESLVEQVKSMRLAFLGRGEMASTNQGIDVVEHVGRESYRTTTMVKYEKVPVAFREQLERLSAQGWRPVMLSPNQEPHAGCFSWLGRGKQSALLSVKELAGGQTSAVTFSEVTPDGGS